jgi:hypothetical protein
MCNQPLVIESLTVTQLEELMVEAEFYELEELQVLLGIETDKTRFASAVVAVEHPKFDNFTALMSYKVKQSVEDLQMRRAQHAKQTRTLERLIEKIKACVSPDKVTLQVQEHGVFLSTTLATLSKQDGPLRRKFSNGWCVNGGPVFVDKDARSLELILNVLRGYPRPVSSREILLYFLNLNVSCSIR